MHFNPNAFRRPRPNGGIGNLGNAPGRRAAAPVVVELGLHAVAPDPGQGAGCGRGGNVRIQLQLYNMWDAVQFTQMDATYTFSATGNTAANTGKYTQTTNPLNVGADVPTGFLTSDKGEGTRQRENLPSLFPSPLTRRVRPRCAHSILRARSRARMASSSAPHSSPILTDMANIAVVGALDTKGAEVAFLRDQIAERGHTPARRSTSA